ADQDAVIAGPRRRAAPPAAGTTQAAPAAAYRRSPVGGAGIADGSADAGTVETSGDAEAGGRVAADAGDGPSDAGVGAGVAVHAASATARAQARRDRFARDQISTPDASRNPANRGPLPGPAVVGRDPAPNVTPRISCRDRSTAPVSRRGASHGRP